MPIKSRSNKKENTKSKEALEPRNDDDANQSSAPVIPGLKLLAMLKEKNANKKSSESQMQSHESKIIKRKSRLPVNIVSLDDSNINENANGSKNEKVKNTPTKKNAVKNVATIDHMEVVCEEETVIKRRGRRPGKKEVEEIEELNDIEQSKSKKARLDMEDKMDVEESLGVKNDRRHKTKVEIKDNVCEPKETVVESLEEVNKKGTRKTKLMDKERALAEESTVVETAIADEPKRVGRRKTKLVPKENQSSEEKPQEITESVPMETEEVPIEKKTTGSRKTKLGIKEVHTENQENSVTEVVDIEENTKNGRRQKTKVDTKDRCLVIEDDSKKIPGLVMLHNLKERKSAILSCDGNIKPTVSATKIPQLIAPAMGNLSESLSIFGGATSLRRQKPAVQILDEKPTIKEKNDTKSTKNEVLVDKAEQMEVPLSNSFVIQEKPKSSFLKKVTQPTSEIIPGLAGLTDLKRRKSLLHGAIVNPRLKETIGKDTPSKEKVTQMEMSEIVKETATNQKKIIPGLADLSELKRRKSEEVKLPEKPLETVGIPMSTKSPLPTLNLRQPSPKALNPFISTVRSSVLYQTPPRIAQRQPAPQSVFHTPQSSVLHTPSSILRTPTSILRTPSSYLKSTESLMPSQAQSSVSKRPISCLSDEDESSTMTTTEPLFKRARIEERVFTPSRRQSVTFNNRVEVKEIRGDSFNESTEDSEATDMLRMKQQLTDSIEQTKRDLMNKRLSFNGTGTSNPFSVTTSTPTMKHYGTTPVRKNSSVSDYLASKKKAEIGSHFGTPSVNTSFNFSNLSARNPIPSQGQSKLNGAFNNEISDDEMDVEEVKEDKSACVIQ